MKALTQNLLLLKIEKKVHKIINKKYKHLIDNTNLTKSYQHWVWSDYEYFADIINSDTIMGGG